jgi:crossover junction endodeoxyribonuclease RuvC
MGIDPGAEGAVALLTKGTAYVGDIPTLKVKRSGGTKTETNMPALVAAFRELKPMRGYLQVAVEQAQVQVQGRGNTAYIAFRVGVFYGQMVGVVAALGLPYARIAPVAWKKAMGLTGTDKEASRLAALELFPGASMGLTRRKDHNRADAILIAEYHRRRLSGGNL